MSSRNSAKALTECSSSLATRTSSRPPASSACRRPSPIACMDKIGHPLLQTVGYLAAREMAFLLISRHANHLDRWQLDADGDDSFVSNPKMRAAYDLVYSEFAGLIVAGRQELGHDLLSLDGVEPQLLPVLLVAKRAQQLDFRAGYHLPEDGLRGACFSIVLMGFGGDSRAMLPRNPHAAHARLLDEVGAVDQVGIEERVAKFTTRSIKKAAKVWGLKMAVSMTDLTTLEGKDTPGKIESLCRKAHQPARRPGGPPGGRGLRLSLDGRAARSRTSRARASRSPRWPRPSLRARPTCRTRLAEVRGAVADGADEIDMVINRGAFLAGRVHRGAGRDLERGRGLRRRGAQGHPRGERAGDLRQHPRGLLPRDGRPAAGRLHQDEHGQDHAQRHARQQPGDDRGDPRLLPRHGRSPSG